MAFLGNTPTTQAFTPAVDYFSGNGSTTAFTLSRPVASVAQVQVVVNNVAQNPSSAYTVSSNTITFTSAPSSGTNNIYVYYTSPITQVIAPGQGTVTTTSLASNLVTPIANGGTNSTATPTAGGIGYGTGTANAYTAAGTSGQALLSNGTSAPTWGNVQAFASGTIMLFVQTSAPTGWTKSTTHDNKALRVVSGSASTGGSVAFTTAFASGLSAGSTTLSTAQMPSHSHNYTLRSGGAGGQSTPNPGGSENPITGSTTSEGSSNSHNHSLPSFAVQYVDVIIATKD